MKILYIAFACDPYAGSEAQCGWSWPMSMRKHANVSILTRKQNKENIEKYMRDKCISDINVYYFDVPNILNVYYKTGRFYYIYYLLWQMLSYSYINDLYKIKDFDYIHHVTLGDFRCISPAYKLSTRFIYGPVGGAQLTPESLKKYAMTDFKTEKIREKINKMIGYSPIYRRALNKAYLVFAANAETQKYLQKYIKNYGKCLLLTENGMNHEQVSMDVVRSNQEPVVLLWSGRMVARKGLDFLIDVMKDVAAKKTFVLKIVGDGPEKSKLEKKVLELGLSEKIYFVGRVPYTEMKQIYMASDIFVFPSLRETTGTVLFEAMSYRIPIITFSQNGADLLIDDSCGRKVDINQPIEKIKSDFALYITELIDDVELREKLGNSAYNKILNEYLWEKKCERFFEAYLKE